MNDLCKVISFIIATLSFHAHAFYLHFLLTLSTLSYNTDNDVYNNNDAYNNEELMRKMIWHVGCSMEYVYI